MKNLFGQESMLYQSLSFLADIMILTVQWLIACVPVVTFGASTTALYSCIMKMQKGEGVRLFRDFWTAFKSNFLQATALWGVLVLLLATAGADLYLVFFTEFNPGTILKLLMLVLVLVISMISAYVFPLQAFFVNPVGRTLKNAFLLAVMYLPVSVVITVVNFLPFLVWLLIPELFNRLLLLWVVLAPGCVAYINSNMFRRIFERHITKEPEEAEASEA